MGKEFSTNRKIAKAGIIVAFFTILVKLTALIKEIIVARQFGRGDGIDAYLIALMLPSFFVNVIAGSFNAALIPTYIQVKHKEGEKKAQELFSNVLTFSLIIIFIVIVLLIGLAKYYLPVLGSNFSSEKLLLTQKILYILVFILLLNGLITLWNSILNADERFTLAAWAPISLPLMIIIFVYFFSNKWGIFSLAYGTVVGTALNVFILYFGLKKQNVKIKLGWHYDKYTRQVLHQYLPMVGGALIMGSSTLIDRSMAAMLPSGSVAALGYGYKIISFFAGIIVFALSTALLPYFSKQEAENDIKSMEHTYNTFFSVALWISIPVMIFIILFSEPIIKIIFQHGAFTFRDTKIVSKVQIYYSFMIPTYVISILGVRLISSKLGNKILMYGAILNAIVNVLFNLILMKYLGVMGIALSTSIVYFISNLYILYFVINKYKIKITKQTGFTMILFFFYIGLFIILMNIIHDYLLKLLFYSIITIIFMGIFIILLKRGEKIG